MSRSIQRKFKIVPLIHPAGAAITTSTDGQNTAVDTKGFSEGLVLVHSGVLDNVTINIDIQHSDEAAANFATLPVPVNTKINPRLLQLVNADDNGVTVGYLNFASGSIKRYIKPVDTLNANSTNVFYTMMVILFGPEDSGQTDDGDQAYEADATS